MNSEKKIVYLIENDKVRRQRLQTVLTFIGEQVTVIDAWSGSVPKDNALCIIAGGGVDNLEQLASSLPELPFICTSAEQTAALQRANVLGPIADSVDYQELSRWLHYCQAYHRSLTSRYVTGDQKRGLLDSMLVGQSDAIQSIKQMISQVAGSDANVLVLGESGTGKEVVARGIHEVSARKNGPFVPVNCGAIPAELLESELFGHEKGAFTGAIGMRKGRFELAQGGTLFLDEIGDMPLAMQVKLLRVLQERNFERVGGSKSIEADVRVVAATHRQLETMISEGKFREDLYYRLNVFPIEVPALRQRQEDVPLLLHELTARFKKDRGVGLRFTEQSLASLSKHQWPGNVRELSNLIERLSIMHPDQLVDVQNLPPKYQHVDYLPEEPEFPDELLEREALNSIFADDDFDETDSQEDADRLLGSELPDAGVNLKDMLSELEVEMIKQALEKTDGVVAKAAELLSMRRTTLVEKMKKYQIK
ncbi:sigma-54 dependent transcriptional regulator [Idiomarina seosinensis]|uniref:sigma-54 dependent transcriptional regulator n=1 Tax=Idiomarina seosinensis TaxID=281739 RepID=UPI00384BEA7B